MQRSPHPQYPEASQVRAALSAALYRARCARKISGTDLIARHDAAAGRAAAQATRAGLAEQLLPALQAATPEVVERAEGRTPSLRRYPVGMASPKVRTALRSGDIAAWDLDRLCAVSASLDHRVEAILVPAGMRAVVSFEPA